MTTDDPRVMSWGTIVALLGATALGAGVMLGLLGDALALPPGRTVAGVGAVVGVMAAVLVARRRAALARAGTPR